MLPLYASILIKAYLGTISKAKEYLEITVHIKDPFGAVLEVKGPFYG